MRPAQPTRQELEAGWRAWDRLQRALFSLDNRCLDDYAARWYRNLELKAHASR